MKKAGIALLSVQDLKKASATGFEYVEYMGKYVASLDRPEFEELLVKTGEENAAREAKGEKKLDVYALNAYCAKDLRMHGEGYDPAAASAYAERLAERAARLDVRYVGIGSPFSRTMQEGEDRERAMAQMEEFLTVTARAFGPCGITVCLEPLATCYCDFINTVSEAAAVVRRLSEPGIKMVVDFYNMEKMGEGDLDLAPYMDIIAHAHISDDDGSPQQRSYLDPAKRGIHRRRIGALLDAGYKGNYTLEMDVGIDCARAMSSKEILTI